MPKPYSDPARKAWPFLAFFVMAGFGFMIPFVLQGVRDYRIAKVFVATQCEITGERAVTSTSSSRLGGRWVESHHSHTEYTWAYRVNGQGYRAEGYDNHSGIMSPDETESIAVGAKHACWYNPADPVDSVLVRKFRGKFYLGALIPGSFIFLGGITLLGVLRRKPMQVDAYVSRGSMLSIRLLPVLSTKGVFGCLGLILAVVGAVTVSLFLKMRHHELDDGWGWILLACLGADGFLIYHLFRAFTAARIADPIVEIDADPLLPGQTSKLYIRQDGPARFAKFKVSLVCEKVGPKGNGKPTNQCIFDREPLEVGQAEEFNESFTIPAKASPSVKTVQTSTTWCIRVRRKLAGGMQYDTDYPFHLVEKTDESAGVDAEST